MKAQFIVTVEGKWLENGQAATAADVERQLRRAAKDCFEDLADCVTVKRTAHAAQAAPDAGME